MDHQALFSVVLLQAIGHPWFLAIDIIGTAAFALSGFILAYREKMTLFGAFILSSFPAIGGGIMRDLIVNRHPIAVLASPLYILTIISVVLTACVAVNLFSVLHRKHPTAFTLFWARGTQMSTILLEICDALGLAAFTVIGVVVSIFKGCAPFWLWGPLLAVLTSCGGGIIRDLFCSKHNHTLLKHCLYGEIAFLWGLFLTLFLREELLIGIVLTIIGAFATRLYAFWAHLPGVPLKFIR